MAGEQWWPAIARLPVLRYDFFGGAFRSALEAPSAGFTVATEILEDFGALVFADARVRLWSGEAGSAFGGWQLRYDGRLPADPQWADGLATFEARGDDRWLERPLLATYAGSGGIEGPEELQGTVKPLILGAARFAPGTLIDATNLVYQLSAYGAIQGLSAVYDRLVSLGASTGDHANLAALLAASIPAGRWATCLAQGLVRLGAPPDGKVCFDVAGDAAGSGGYVRKPGALIGRIAELAAGVADAGNLAALDAARPWNLAVVLTAQTTARQVIQEIADGVAATAGVSWTGPLFVQPLAIGVLEDATLLLDGSGEAEPLVADVAQQRTGAPFWRLATHAEITWVVHDQSEIASQYVWRGDHSLSRTYRIDDAVIAHDRSSWVYTNATPSSGNPLPVWPTTSNTWWENIGEPVTAADVKFGDGSTVEGLQPAEPGADVTSSIPTVPETVIQLDHELQPKAGQLPRTVQFTLIRNGSDETDAATWGVAVLSGVIDPGDIAISNASGTEGRLTFDAPQTDLVLEIEADFSGRVVTTEHKVKLQRDATPASGGGGSGAAGSVEGVINGTVGGTTPVAVSSELEITTGSGGNVTLAAWFEWSSNQLSGSQSLEMRPYKWNGASWVAILTWQAAQNYVPAIAMPAQGGYHGVDSGNAPSTVQKYQFFARAGGSYTAWLSGECGAVTD